MPLGLIIMIFFDSDSAPNARNEALKTTLFFYEKNIKIF
jgi:hypothetical protein